MKFHFCKIKVESKYFYRILNNSKDISLFNLQQENEIFSFDISYKDIDALKDKCHRLNVPIIECTDLGLYTKIFKKSVIQTVSLVLTIFILFLLVNSLFIWNITIDGNYTNSADEILKILNESVNTGMLKSKIDTESLELSLRNKFNNISWVCAEVKGTSLIVHIKETYISEIAKKEDKPYNIVANRKGVIKSIITRKGKAQVKVGDKVKKGDVLIAGKVPVLSEYEEELFNSYYSSDGTIMAQTTRKIDIVLDKQYQHKEESSVYHVYLPTFSNYSWDLKLENRNITRELKTIKLWGEFYLPISIEKYTVEKAKYKSKTYTKEEAETKLNNKFLYKLSKMEQKDYKILKKDVKIVEDKKSFKLSGEIQCIEPLGKVDYITIEEVEEGTTNLNEYN